MNNYKTYIYLTLLTLLSCKSNDGNEPQKLTPQIRYEFSGGAGHYNYAPHAEWQDLSGVWKSRPNLTIFP